MKINLKVRAPLCCLIFLFVVSITQAQSGIRAFGIQFKPIFPLGIVNTDGQTVNEENQQSTLEIKNSNGYNIGAVIRIGISNRISLETGINYVQRNYDFLLTSPDYPRSEASVRFTGYELPLQALVFVRLGQQMFMNASGGFVLDLFPTGGVVSYDRDTIEYGLLESNWIIPAINANLGFEYRTKKQGYFYVGSSYHLPLKDIATVFVSYRVPGSNNYEELITSEPTVSGSYLTLDLKYFFNPGMKEKVNSE